MVTIFSFGQMTSENREWRHIPYTSFCPCLWQSCFAHFRKVEDLVSKIYIACLIYRENIAGNLFSMIRKSPHLNRFQFDVTTSLWRIRGPSLTSCRFLYHSFFDGCMYLYTAHVTYHVLWRFTILLSEID